MGSSHTVVHLTTVHHPYDVRIYHKECLSLYKAGYNVYLIAPDSNNDKEVPIKHIKLKTYNSRLKRMIFGTFDAYRKAKKIKANVYHFHDPELMIVAWLLKNRKNVVVYDVHEDFITSLIKKDYLNKWLKKIIKNTFKTIEKFFTRKFKKVLAEKYYIENHPDGHYILNYPILNDDIDKHERTYETLDNALIYTGNVDVQRGAYIHARLPLIHHDIECYVIGKCDETYANKMFDIAGGHKDRLKIDGINRFVEKEAIEEAYYNRNWLAGLALFPPTDHYLRKELTKFFEYMNAGIPILCSNFPAWKQFIEEYDCGIAVDPFNEEEIRDAIEFLRNNPDEVKRMGENGKRAVHENLNWDTQAKKLVQLYENWI